MSMSVYVFLNFNTLKYYFNAECNFFKCILYSFNVLSVVSVMYQPMKEYSIRFLFEAY